MERLAGRLAPQRAVRTGRLVRDPMLRDDPRGHGLAVPALLRGGFPSGIPAQRFQHQVRYITRALASDKKGERPPRSAAEGGAEVNAKSIALRGMTECIPH